jgi:hypothetical protein
VRLVATGATNREVGEQLFLSPHTVNAHLRHVFGKLDIRSRVELAGLVAKREAMPPSGDAVPSGDVLSPSPIGGRTRDAAPNGTPAGVGQKHPLGR